MEVFPFVFYHLLESVHLCFEAIPEGCLPDFVENAVDHVFFSVLPVRDVVFGEFSLDITKEEEVAWGEAGLAVRCGIRWIFYVKTFSGSFAMMWVCIVHVDI
jgi:hypothetical protein